MPRVKRRIQQWGRLGYRKRIALICFPNRWIGAVQLAQVTALGPVIEHHQYAPGPAVNAACESTKSRSLPLPCARAFRL